MGSAGLTGSRRGVARTVGSLEPHRGCGAVQQAVARCPYGCRKLVVSLAAGARGEQCAWDLNRSLREKTIGLGCGY